MHSVNIHEAKTHLSELIAKVERGEDIIIARAGKPVAQLIAYKAPKPPLREPGGWEGKVWMSPDFDECDAEIEKLFYEGDLSPDEPEK